LTLRGSYFTWSWEHFSKNFDEFVLLNFPKVASIGLYELLSTNFENESKAKCDFTDFFILYGTDEVYTKNLT